MRGDGNDILFMHVLRNETDLYRTLQSQSLCRRLNYNHDRSIIQCVRCTNVDEEYESKVRCVTVFRKQGDPRHFAFLKVCTEVV